MRTLLALAALLLTPLAAGAQKWAVLPFQSNLDDPRIADTFRELLAEGLQRDGTTVQLADDGTCRDAPCARDVGARHGAEVAVFGGLRWLGQHVIVIATAVNVGDGSVRSSSSMTAEKIEELDTVATRMARAIELGTTAKETIELGTVTKHEIPAPQRREGTRGAALRFAMIGPVNAHAGNQLGVLFGLSYWFEAASFALEPRVSFSFDVDHDAGTWWELPWELGGYYIFSRGDIAPILGGGGGLTYFHETRASPLGGNIVITGASAEDEEGAWGASVFARGGVLLFRTYEMRVALTAEYRALFVDVHDATPQSLSGGMEVVF